MDRALVPPTREAVVPDAHRPNAIVENARREFASVFGDLARGKRNWQVVAFALAGVVAVEALAMIGLARAARVVPYVVRVDQLGRVDAVGPASPMRDPDATLVASQLADFIRSVRTVLPLAAVNAQTALLRHGYAFATPEAAGFLNTYLSDATHDPRVLGLRLTREVAVTSALRVPDATTGRKRIADNGGVQIRGGCNGRRRIAPRSSAAQQRRPRGKGISPSASHRRRPQNPFRRILSDSSLRRSPGLG